jgi:ribosomal protein S18 acetylase RimI-like enzyme
MPLRSISKVEDVFAFQNNAKLLGIDYVSNNYLFADSLLYLIRNKSLFGHFEEDATLIIDKSSVALPRLLYFAANPDSLNNTIKKSNLKEEVLVELRHLEYNLVGKIFLQNNFSTYEVLLEYQLLGDTPKETINDYVVSFAQKSDLESIRFLIDANFDPLIDVIPKESEISSYIDSRNVLVARAKHDSKSIVGLCISFAAGNSTKIHFLVVANEFRGMGIANNLLGALRVNSKGRIQLWVKESNIGAVAFYLRVGFQVGENKRYFLRGEL